MVIGCLRLSDVSDICRVVNPRRTSQKIWGGFLHVKFGQWEIGEIVHCLPDKKYIISPGSPAVATVRIVPKICQGLPPTMYSRVLQISSKSVHFQWSYSQNKWFHGVMVKHLYVKFAASLFDKPTDKQP